MQTNRYTEEEQVLYGREQLTKENESLCVAAIMCGWKPQHGRDDRLITCAIFEHPNGHLFINVRSRAIGSMVGVIVYSVVKNDPSPYCKELTHLCKVMRERGMFEHGAMNEVRVDTACATRLVTLQIDPIDLFKEIIEKHEEVHGAR